MRTFLPAFAVAVLSSIPLTAQPGTFTVYGSGCPGTGGTSCLSANWTQPFGGGGAALANFALPFNTGSSARVVCGIELICKTRNNTNVSVKVWIYDTASTGAPGKILRASTMPVTPTAKPNRATFQPLVLAAKTQFFIVINNAAGLNMPIMSSGTRNIHYWNGPPTWRGPFTSVAWNYSVICCGSGKVPKISNTGVPALGKSFSIDLSQARGGAKTLLAIGLARTNTDLTAFGAPGCRLLTNPLAVLGFTTNGAGTLTFPQNVPNDSTLLGLKFNTQFAVNDQVNALQLVFSAGGEGKVGK